MEEMIKRVICKDENEYITNIFDYNEKGNQIHLL